MTPTSRSEPESRAHERTVRHAYQVGRSYCYIRCPFCDLTVKAYVWSLAGGGKKCPRCGALHTYSGRSIKRSVDLA